MTLTPKNRMRGCSCSTEREYEPHQRKFRFPGSTTARSVEHLPNPLHVERLSLGHRLSRGLISCGCFNFQSVEPHLWKRCYVRGEQVRDSQPSRKLTMGCAWVRKARARVKGVTLHADSLAELRAELVGDSVPKCEATDRRALILELKHGIPRGVCL